MKETKKIEILPADASPVKLTWKVYEEIGPAVIDPILFMPKEEREKLQAARIELLRKLQEEGDPAVPGAPYVCPNGCAGPFRTHGKTTTLVGWGGGLDPNHWTEQCSCEACGARFLKEWVWANDYGRPWYSVWEDNKKVVYHGVPTCCESCYTRREPK